MMFQRLDEELAAYPATLPHDYARRELVDGAPPSALLDDPAQAAQVPGYERCQALWASEAESLTTLSSWNAAVYPILGLFRSDAHVGAVPGAPGGEQGGRHATLADRAAVAAPRMTVCG